MMYSYSKRGVSHYQKGIVNQDAVFCAKQEGFEAIAVADGVGACENAAIGSQFVVRFMVRYAYDHFDELARMSNEEIKALILSSFKKEYSKADIPVKTALSTLLFVAKKGTKVLFLQIGDGKIILVSKGQSSQVFPDAGLPLNQSYTWNSSPECFCKMILDTRAFVMDFILLCTDGVYKPDRAMVEYNGGLSYLDYTATTQLYREKDAEGYQNFINTVVTSTDGHFGDFDDKTAALMVLR